MGGRVYVGNLKADISEWELDDEFRRFGVLKSIWIARKPPGFAFVEYDNPRDADDAVRRLDGFQGWRVEISRLGNRGGGGFGGGGYGARGRSPPRRGRTPPRRRSPSYEPRPRRSPSYEPRPRRSPSYDAPRRRSPSYTPRRRSPSLDRRSRSRS